MNRLLQTITPIFFILLSACHQTPVKLQAIEQDQNIVAFGDSLTKGYGATPEQSWPAILDTLSHRHVINEGINGDTTEGGKERLNSVLDEDKPSLVILSLGGNDMLHHQDHNQMINNINSMIDTIQAHGSQVVILAEPQPEITSRLEDAKFYQNIAQKKQILIIKDVYASLLSKPENKSDLIHLNAQGYNQAASLINAQLQSAGAY